MGAISSFDKLEKLGREQLSKSFYMRDFLYSEIANFYGLPNLPEDYDQAIEVGKQLCETLLEPLQDRFGRIAIRSAYRSCTVNAEGNRRGHKCASNEKNYAGHIWDRTDNEGLKGATACIVIPWFAERYEAGTDWRAMAWWVHDHLNYSEMEFFPTRAAFNINWHEKPKRKIYSYIAPNKGYLTQPGMDNHQDDHSNWFGDLI
jgi:hypothetical protein